MSPVGSRAGVNGQLDFQRLTARPLLGELLCLAPTRRALPSLQLQGWATTLRCLAEAWVGWKAGLSSSHGLRACNEATRENSKLAVGLLVFSIHCCKTLALTQTYP